MYWHVLFVLGGHEEKIVNKINESDHEAFLPKVKKLFKRNSTINKEDVLLFKNYVFVKSNENTINFQKYIQNEIQHMTGFIKLLKHDTHTESLYPHEKEFLMKFTDEENVIDESQGLINGDKIIITQGPLMGFESLIRKIDRHKRIAQLEIDMFGDKRTITVGLEIISKQ
ncbi:MAG: transcription antiterminator [Firmicutes bacterium HGW-Firmicutes-10]|jgi:transcriptional antiterminator NusG|nr:MAG: transcription antiterminator [Firmicutes bacterium HGW-Firmicutes-10]